MNFKIIPPAPQLADYVRFFWFSEAFASTEKPFAHHAFAYSCPEFIFCYKGGFKYSSQLQGERVLASGVNGQTQSFCKISATESFGIFGFYLYPHAFPQLFSLPANELTNQHADMKALCGKDGQVLEEKILLAESNSQRVKIASEFLKGRLKNVKTGYSTIVSTIKAISHAYTENSVNSLANDNYLSVRQFERKFKEFSGFSPKLFLRITRFNSLLNKRFHDTSLTQIAYEYGYHDQSHFIHDFQQFSGYNPKEYFRPETMAATDRGTVEF